MEYSVTDLGQIFELQSKQVWINKVTTANERIGVLRELKESIKSREVMIQDALQADLRKGLAGAQAELSTVYTDIDHAIENVAEWMKPEEVKTSPMFAGSRAKVVHEALGVVLLFGPWNFPFSLIFQPLTAIIAAGNCALVKPNEMAPNISAVTAEIIRSVFDKKNVAVFEGGVELANEMLELPVNHIFFTGSPAVGKIVMTAAAKHLASVTLELGGKNPVVIDRTADLKDAATKIAIMRTLNSGQVCLCPENVWVPEEKEQEFLSIVQSVFQGMYYKDGNIVPDLIGKIIDKNNIKRIAGYIDNAKECGAKVYCGGQVDEQNSVVHPTILTGVPAVADIMHEETFGPILNVFTYKNIDEAIVSIQSQPKPLALYIFTKEQEFIDSMLERTSSGGVTVNNCLMHCVEPNLPFGGVNNSGMGSYHGVFGFRQLSHQRAVLIMEC
jgi:aldehyde dehydrogenase (NAD+)